MLKVKIIGCGNPLAGDDGVGVYLIDQLKTFALPKGVSVVEGGTDPLNLLEMLRGQKKVILVDAFKGAGKPGEVFVLGMEQLDLDTERGLSLHGFNLAHVLRLGQTLYPKDLPEEIVIIGVEIEAAAPFTTGLSPAVEAALPKLLQTVLEEISG